MDKRDPVVMQAIANVIGTRTMDAGCLGPPPGQTQAIYDEIKRLDRARLEAEHRRTVEIQADLMTSIDVAVLPASASTTGVINMAAAVCEPSASILDGRRREAATLDPIGSNDFAQWLLTYLLASQTFKTSSGFSSVAGAVLNPGRVYWTLLRFKDNRHCR